MTWSFISSDQKIVKRKNAGLSHPLKKTEGHFLREEAWGVVDVGTRITQKTGATSRRIFHQRTKYKLSVLVCCCSP
jgi:hypothetical protein